MFVPEKILVPKKKLKFFWILKKMGSPKICGFPNKSWVSKFFGYPLSGLKAMHEEEKRRKYSREYGWQTKFQLPE